MAQEISKEEWVELSKKLRDWVQANFTPTLASDRRLHSLVVSFDLQQWWRPHQCGPPVAHPSLACLLIKSDSRGTANEYLP
jgi:hypothetical protein